MKTPESQSFPFLVGGGVVPSRAVPAGTDGWMDGWMRADGWIVFVVRSVGKRKKEARVSSDTDADADANDVRKSWSVTPTDTRRASITRFVFFKTKTKPNPTLETRRGKDDDAHDDEQDDGCDDGDDANEREDDDACERANARGEAGAGEPVV